MPPRKKPVVSKAAENGVSPGDVAETPSDTVVSSVVAAMGASIVSSSNVAESSVPVLDSTQTKVGTTTKAKREKKTTKHKVVAVVTADGIQGAFQNETRRPLIVSLPIHSSDIQFHDQLFTYDPRPPTTYEAFNADITDPFAEESTYEKVPQGDQILDSKTAHQEKEIDSSTYQTTTTIVQFDEQKENHVAASHPVSHPRTEYGPTTLLVQFSSTKQTHELPSESSLGCFWCCETFSGRPCVIPTRVLENIWHVYGNFCTPQCGMAYLLSEILDTHTRWERIALLHRLYGAQCAGKVYPAPSREVLQRFGGPVNGVDFRAICEGQRVRVDIAQPPMVSILASMDTKPIDFYETPLRNTFTPPSMYQTTRSSEEPKSLTLKRTKPLKDRESTLDSCFTQMVRA
jgi:hypothetical protein